MKAKEIIEGIDLSGNDDKWVIPTIAEDLGFDYIQIENIDQAKNEKIRSAFVIKWLCTDTVVGVRAYFFDGEFCCLSKQECRKCDEEVIGWVSQAMADKVHDYLHSLIPQKEKVEIEVLEDIDTADWGNGYTVSGAEAISIVGKGGKLIYNEHTVEYINSPSHIDGKMNFDKIVIMDEGKEKTISVSDVLVPYPVNINTDKRD